MTEDDRFRETIKSAPADDLTRLVYADWLDEHDRPVEAEYLRLLSELRRVTARLTTLRGQLDRRWVADINPWCRVVLTRIFPERRLEAVRLVRELTDESMASVRKRVADPPVLLRGGLSLEAATRLATVFEPVGEVAIEPEPPTVDAGYVR